MTKRIHIMVAEPSAIIRCGVVTLLQRITELCCDIIEVGDVTTLLSGVQKNAPDLLIVNPSQLGIFSMAQLRVELGNEDMKIVALQTSFADHGQLQNYDEAISIYDSSETLCDKILNVTKSKPEVDSKRELSQREREVLICVVKGMTNKLIADTLNLSPHTVIAHRRNIANKLQIHSPSGLTIYAIVNKLVDLSDIKNSISQIKDSE